MKIDELNAPVTKYEYSDFASYYEPMQITEEQKEKRTETAHDLFFDFLMLFALLQQGMETGDLDYLFVLQQFQDMYADTVSKYARTDDYTREYVDSFTRETMDTTWSHLDLSEEQSYWLSDDRASILALNESNTINNYEDLQKAKDEGKNVKIWKTMNDTRVRDSHRKLEGKKIGIDEYFHVGSSLLLFPRDYVHCSNIRDIAGCRCSEKAEYDPKYRDRNDIGEMKKELNRGRSIRNTNELQKYSNSSIMNMSTKEDIIQYFSDTHGVEIIGLSDNYFEASKYSLSGVDDMLNAYPEAKRAVKLIDFTKNIDDYGKWTNTGIISIYRRGRSDYGTGVHEVTHAIDFVRNRRIFAKNGSTEYATNILTQARKNLGLKVNSKKYKDYITQIVGDMEYAQKSSEVIAYAMETALTGVNNELAIEIERLIRLNL